MAGIEGDAQHVDSLDRLAGCWPDPIAVVHLAARVVREPGENADVVTSTLELLGEQQPLEGRFRVEPLAEDEDPHAVTSPPARRGRRRSRARCLRRSVRT